MMSLMATMMVLSALVAWGVAAWVRHRAEMLRLVQIPHAAGVGTGARHIARRRRQRAMADPIGRCLLRVAAVGVWLRAVGVCTTAGWCNCVGCREARRPCLNSEVALT